MSSVLWFMAGSMTTLVLSLAWATWMIHTYKVKGYRWCTECLKPCDEDGYCDPCAVKAVARWRRGEDC